MVDLISLTNAMVDTLRRIPDLVSALSDPAFINAYIDVSPATNSLQAAIYDMKPGSILVAWAETLLITEDMSMWSHRHETYVKAARGGSALELIVKIVNGIPVPGDGLRWRFCPVMDGVVLPTEIVDIQRVPDVEGVDFFIITTETKETGDA